MINEKRCCFYGFCVDWRDWGEVLNGWLFGKDWIEWFVYIVMVIVLVVVFCLMMLMIKMVVFLVYWFMMLDENLVVENVVYMGDYDNDDGVNISLCYLCVDG